MPLSNAEAVAKTILARLIDPGGGVPDSTDLNVLVDAIKDGQAHEGVAALQTLIAGMMKLVLDARDDLPPQSPPLPQLNYMFRAQARPRGRKKG